MTTEETANDVLSSDPTVLTLSTGTQIRVERLKTRQLLRAVKVLTNGAADVMSGLQFDSEDEDGFAANILASVLFAVPEAEDETIDFVKSMVSPAGIIEHPKSKAEKALNEDLYQQLDKELFNPELEDLISIVEVIVKNEAPHIVALGKRLMLLIPTKTVAPTPTKKSNKN